MLVKIAQQKLNQLELEIERLKNENRSLKSQRIYHYKKRESILHYASVYAKMICVYHCSGLPTTRNFCMDAGIPMRKYYWSVGFLRRARLMEYRGSDITCSEIEVCEQRINDTYKILIDRIDAIEILRLYMPKNY